MRKEVFVIEKPDGRLDIRYEDDGKKPEEICSGLPYTVLPIEKVPSRSEYRNGWILSEDKKEILEGIFAYDECGTIMAWVPV